MYLREGLHMELPGGVVVHGLTAGQEELLKKRGQFVLDYCKAHGWSVEFEALSIEQILEIRSQDDWKNPK